MLLHVFFIVYGMFYSPVLLAVQPFSQSIYSSLINIRQQQRDPTQQSKLHNKWTVQTEFPSSGQRITNYIILFQRAAIMINSPNFIILNQGP